MTAVGEYGRKPPGESWRLAMARAEQLRAEGSKRRYRIRGRRIAPGWWTYEAVKVSRAVAAPAPRRMPPQPMTKQRIAALAATLPRCAQRGRVAARRRHQGRMAASPGVAGGEHAGAVRVSV